MHSLIGVDLLVFSFTDGGHKIKVLYKTQCEAKMLLYWLSAFCSSKANVGRAVS